MGPDWSKMADQKLLTDHHAPLPEAVSRENCHGTLPHPDARVTLRDIGEVLVLLQTRDLSISWVACLSQGDHY